MTRKIFNSSSSLTDMRNKASLLPQFVRRFSLAGVRPRFPLPPLGSIGDPYLLDRLHAPLRRHRD